MNVIVEDKTKIKEGEKPLAILNYEISENRMSIFLHDKVSPPELRRENDKKVQYELYQACGYSNFDYLIQCEKNWSINKLKQKIVEEIKKVFFKNKNKNI
jgi:hypothetical protein